MQSYSDIDLLLLIIAFVALPAMSAISGRTLDRIPRSELNLVPRYWLIFIRGLFVSLLILFQSRWTGRPFFTLGLDVPIGYWGRWGFVFDVAIGCYYAAALLIRKISPERLVSVRGRLERYRILPRTHGEFVLYWPMAVAGSIMEELLYRGFLFWILTPFAGLWGAV